MEDDRMKKFETMTGKDINVIYAILGRNEFIKLKRYIKEIDSRAFISVRESHEVLGEGFLSLSDEQKKDCLCNGQPFCIQRNINIEYICQFLENDNVIM